MSRKEFSRKVRQQAIERANGPIQVVRCSHCHDEFDRGYRISAKRASRPQFCSAECMRSERRLSAETALASSFWQNAERQPNGCLYWRGRIDYKGYGRIDAGGKPRLAHRIAYEMAFGCDPGDLNVCHSCDTPRCIEPSHLWLGTQSDNMSDAAKKGRLSKVRAIGEANPSSKLTESQARQIKFGDDPAPKMAARMGVSKEAIYAIRNGKNWRWLT